MEWLFLVAFIAWIVFTIKGYRHLTRDCGYSDIVALLIAWLLGPFALALSPNGVPCPHCRCLVDRKATVCPRCTRDVATK